MAGPALGVLLLLFPLLVAFSGACTGLGGELDPQGGALRCPQPCRGAYRLFACCPTGEAQLGGRWGPSEAPAAYLPPPTQPSSPTKPPAPPPTQFMEDWAGLLPFAGVLSGVTLWSIFRYWKKQPWCLQRPVWSSRLLNLWNPRPIRLEEFDLSSCGGTPPPYAADPPPYGEEQPSADGSSPPQVVPFHHASSESSEDEVMIGSLVHRNFASRYYSESTLEEDLLASQ